MATVDAELVEAIRALKADMMYLADLVLREHVEPEELPQMSNRHRVRINAFLDEHRHLAGDVARTEEGTPTNKAGAGVGVCRICGADIWISEGDTCKEPCQP